MAEIRTKPQNTKSFFYSKIIENPSPFVCRYMYEAGAIDRSDKANAEIINPRIMAKERKKDFQITIASRMRYRTRYFTDSGIIGSKEFVSSHYQHFKHLFASKHEKIPKPVKGLSGMYSLKRLSEII